MKKKGLVAALVLAVAAVSLSGCVPDSGPVASVAVGQQQGVWVTGEGRMSVAPDIATLSLGIEALADTVSEAQAQANAAMGRVMAALADGGVAPEDIQTRVFSIRQETRFDRETEEQVVTGYRVTNRVSAKIRDIARVGSIIDAVAAAGGDLTRVDGVSFSVDDPSVYLEELRGEAMADAKAKAEQLARLANVRLGKPTLISETSLLPPPVPLAFERVAQAEFAPTPISPGEIELTLNVQVVYEIRR